MRLIDTEQLEYKDFITPIRDKDGMVYPLHRLGVTKEDIKNAPTIDAVPVVRCKDCSHYRTNNTMGYPHCEILKRFVTGDWFCSYGERKDT